MLGLPNMLFVAWFDVESFLVLFVNPFCLLALE